MPLRKGANIRATGFFATSMTAVSVARSPRARGELGLGAEMTKGTAETKHGILLKHARHTAETPMYKKETLCSLMVEKVFYR